MRIRVVFGSIMLAFISTAAAGQDTVITHRGETGVPVAISFEAGTAYNHSFRLAGLIPVKTQPQIAVWAETPDGKYLATLYVSRRSAVQDWRGGKKVRRPEALPCWSHRRGIRYSDGLFMPASDNPLPDAETSATPRGSFTVRTILPAGRERVAIFVELNQSFDYNTSFTKDAKPGRKGYSGVNGQPSAIYSGEFIPGAGEESVELRLIGCGSLDGTDGAIGSDFSMLTTAKEIARKITVRKE